MTRVIIFEKNIKDKLWPKHILIITYIKNNQPIKALQNSISLYTIYSRKVFNLAHLWILDFIVYILLYKEERLIKFEKWASRIIKSILGNYNSHTIYQVYIKD